MEECEECGQAFISEDSLLHHIDLFHGEHINQNSDGEFTKELQNQFIQYLRGGAGPLTAARKVGLTPRQLTHYIQSSADFAEDCKLAEQEAAEVIEQHLYDMATSKDFRAITKWLDSRSPERWGPDNTIKVDVVHQIKAAPLEERVALLAEVLAQRFHSSQELDIIETKALPPKDSDGPY